MLVRVVILARDAGRVFVRVGVGRVVGLVRSALVVVSHGSNHYAEEGEEEPDDYPAIIPPNALMIPATSPARRIWAMSIQTGKAKSANCHQSEKSLMELINGSASTEESFLSVARAAHDAVKEFENTPPVLRIVNNVYTVSIKQFYRQSQESQQW